MRGCTVTVKLRPDQLVLLNSIARQASVGDLSPVISELVDHHAQFLVQRAGQRRGLIPGPSEPRRVEAGKRKYVRLSDEDAREIFRRVEAGSNVPGEAKLLNVSPFNVWRRWKKLGLRRKRQ